MLHLRSTRTRRAAALAVALGLLTGIESRAQQAAPAPQLADLIPSTSVALVSAPDLVAACRALEATDMGKMCGQFGPFVNGIKHGLQEQIAQAEQQLEQGSGVKIDDMLAALGGGVEVAIPTFDAKHGPGAPVALLRTAGREAAVRAVIGQLRAKGAAAGARAQPPGPYTTRGQVAVDVIAMPDGPPVFAAFTRDVLLLSLSPVSENAMLDVAGGQAPPGFAPLSSAPDYTAVRGRTVAAGVPVAFAYFDVGSLIQQAAAGDPEMPKMLAKLGIADIHGMGLGLSVEGGKGILSGYLAAPSSGPRQGIFPIFAQGPVDAARLAALAPGDAGAFLAAHFDFGQAMDATLALVDAMEPEQGRSARAQIADVSKHLGLDIRKDLLGSLGGEWAGVSFEPETGGLAESVLIVNVLNEQGLGKAVRQLADAFKLEQHQIDYHGKEILYLLQPVAPPGSRSSFSRNPLAQMGDFGGVAISISGGHALLAAIPQQIEDYLDKMGSVGVMSPTPERSGMVALSADPAFSRALAAAPKGTSMFGWDNPGASVPAMWNSAVQIAAAFQGLARGNGVPIDVGLLPRGADLAPLTMPGATYVAIDDAGIVMRSQLSLGISGGVVVGVGVSAVVAAIAIPNLIESRKHANEAAAIGALRTLTTAQALYREGDKDNNGVLDYAPDLASLQRNGNLIDAVLASGMKQGYRFAILHADQFTWSATAIPVELYKSGDRSFFVDESGVIRYESGPTPPTAESAAVGSAPRVREVPAAPTTPAHGGAHAVGGEASYKLYFAAAMTGDVAIVVECQKKIGITDASGMPADNMQKWMQDYSDYVQKHAVEITKEIKDKETGRAYYDSHK